MASMPEFDLESNYDWTEFDDRLPFENLNDLIEYQDGNANDEVEVDLSRGYFDVDPANVSTNSANFSADSATVDVDSANLNTSELQFKLPLVIPKEGKSQKFYSHNVNNISPTSNYKLQCNVSDSTSTNASVSINDFEILTSPLPHTHTDSVPCIPKSKRRCLPDQQQQSAVNKLPNYVLEQSADPCPADVDKTADAVPMFEVIGVNKLPEYLVSVSYKCFSNLEESENISLFENAQSNVQEVQQSKNGPSKVLPRPEEESDDEEDFRRIVYVGKICRNSTNKTKLRKRMERFGPVQSVTLHRRDPKQPADDFAFVTFRNRRDAEEAVEGGNAGLKPGMPIYDFGFGGRRRFCRSQYRDLDEEAKEEDNEKNLTYEELLKKNLERARLKTF